MNTTAGITCPDCGATGSQPTHSPDCHRRYITSEIWASPAVAVLREAHAAAEAAWDAYQAAPTSDEDAWAAAREKWTGATHLVTCAAGSLLDVIDDAAGAR